MIKAGFIKHPVWFSGISSDFRKLKRIWYTRTVRRFISGSIRSSLRNDLLKLVNFDLPLSPDLGAVIVICHTPWKRILVQWCLDEKNYLIIAGGKWKGRRVSIQNKATGFKELRKVIDHLRQNGRVVICLTRFNQLQNCPVRFLDSQQNVSTLPVRLSKVGNVPLIMAIPVFSGGVIHFRNGPRVQPAPTHLNSYSLMQTLTHYLDNEITKDPAIWPPYVK